MRPIRVLPNVKVVKVGGQSIIDRGREPLMQVLNEIVGAVESFRCSILLVTGGGTRARSIYSLATDLSLPTGVLAALGARVPIQNARMLATVLASKGGIYIEPDEFQQLPLHFRAGCIPIMGGMPPYAYWEMRDADSRIPPHRTDAGAFLTAEYLGCPEVLYVKDEDGLYTDDPKRNPDATKIDVVTAETLVEMNLRDVVVERRVVEYLPRAVYCRRVRIVNGLKYGQTTDALIGDQPVGSVITTED